MTKTKEERTEYTFKENVKFSLIGTVFITMLYLALFLIIRAFGFGPSYWIAVASGTLFGLCNFTPICMESWKRERR